MWLRLSLYFAYITKAAAIFILFLCGMSIPVGEIWLEHRLMRWDPDFLSTTGNLNAAVGHLETAVVCSIVGGVCFVFLMFTATLYFGITGRHPALILVYLAFGAYVLALVIAGAVAAMTDSDFKTGGYILLGCGQKELKYLLPMLHDLTGCDIVSFFNGRGKTTFPAIYGACLVVISQAYKELNAAMALVTAFSGLERDQ